jgi:hypothetical protein
MGREIVIEILDEAELNEVLKMLDSLQKKGTIALKKGPKIDIRSFYGKLKDLNITEDAIKELRDEWDRELSL